MRFAPRSSAGEGKPACTGQGNNWPTIGPGAKGMGEAQLLSSKDMDQQTKILFICTVY